MPRGLNNKVALITGAAQGIGRGIALRLAQEGVHIGLVDLHQEKLNTVQQEVEAFGVKATTFIADISDSILSIKLLIDLPCIYKASLA